VTCATAQPDRQHPADGRSGCENSGSKIARMTCAPVVLLAFNRPHTVQRMLERFREAAIPRLFVAADGPRAGFANDPDRCREVRELLDTGIDWDCDVVRIYRDRNLGCEGNTELTLDEVFSQIPAAIILDDDCLPDLSFFRFATELLEHYAEDERIMHIAGSNDQAPRELFGPSSYAFTAFGSNWGWATWARAWQRHRSAFPRPHDATTVRVPYGPPPHRFMPQADSRTFTPARQDLVSASARRFFGDVAAARDLSLSEWGQQWRLSMLNVGGLAITPAEHLIENIGFAPDSTSSMPTRDMPAAAPLSFPLVHPSAVSVNPGVERVLERTLVRAVGRLARTVRPRTPARLREAARRVGSVLVR